MRIRERIKINAVKGYIISSDQQISDVMIRLSYCILNRLIDIHVLDLSIFGDENQYKF